MQDRAVAGEIGYLWVAGDPQFLEDSVERSEFLVDMYGALSLEDSEVRAALQDAPTSDSEVFEGTIDGAYGILIACATHLHKVQSLNR